MLAETVQGKVETADLFFLFAMILAVLAAIAYAVRRADVTVWAPVLLSLAVASVALSWWVL